MPKRQSVSPPTVTGDPVQPLVVDQANPISHSPDVPFISHCWWRGEVSSPKAHPAGASGSPQSQESL